MSDTNTHHIYKSGDGATLVMWSDRHAGTVVSVHAKLLYWQRDHVERLDSNGMSESQSYAYYPNPEAPVEAFTLRKNGSWVRKGEGFKNGTRIIPGRHEYYDYSF